jgi:hypothetical protein
MDGALRICVSISPSGACRPKYVSGVVLIA